MEELNSADEKKGSPASQVDQTKLSSVKQMLQGKQQPKNLKEEVKTKPVESPKSAVQPKHIPKAASSNKPKDDKLSDS